MLVSVGRREELVEDLIKSKEANAHSHSKICFCGSPFHIRFRSEVGISHSAGVTWLM